MTPPTGGGSLFRPESIESRRASWLGHPRVVRSMPVTGFAVASLVFAIAILAFLVLGQYTRRVPVTGLVLPPDGLTRLAAPQSGWISEIDVAEGQHVRRGEVLYALRVDSTTSLGDTQGAVAAVLRAKRDELQGALERRGQLDLAEKQGLTSRPGISRASSPRWTRRSGSSIASPASWRSWPSGSRNGSTGA